jgi:hypothetical protein
VIEVRVRVDDEADRLVRDGLLRGRHRRKAARGVLSTLDDADVVAHIEARADSQRRGSDQV